MYKPIGTQKFNRKLFVLPAIILLLIIYVIAALLLPMPKVVAKTENIALEPNKLSTIFWPKADQMAVGAEGYGVLTTNGEQKSHPIASIAKTMVALTVIEQKPLKLGEQGPTLTMTQQDIDSYKANLALNGSVVPVNLNEKLTEYQLLQALLVPSGDNIADTLAIWAFGSVDKYLEYANQKAAAWGLKETKFADASGLSPQTVSSAQNLITIGDKVLDDPVLAEIVSQSDVDLPVVGKVKNYNSILGQDNIIGIKTGNTNEAGGCLLFAAKNAIGGKEIKIIGAILGAKDRATALQNTKIFLERNTNAFGLETIIKKGDIVGTYETPWGKKINAVAKDDLQVLVIDKEKITPKINLQDITSPKNQGDVIGEVSVDANGTTIKTSVILQNKFTKPPFYWKIIHP